jgi:hypothetical protein
MSVWVTALIEHPVDGHGVRRANSSRLGPSAGIAGLVADHERAFAVISLVEAMR